MYSIAINQKLDKKIDKLSKKSKNTYLALMSKIEEIKINPENYKNLHHPMQMYKRVHINKSFVLIFSINKKDGIITLEEFDHHDNIYKN